MPSFDWGPRKAPTELRLRHLHMVEEHGFGPDYDRAALQKYLLDNEATDECKTRIRFEQLSGTKVAIMS